MTKDSFASKYATNEKVLNKTLERLIENYANNNG